MFHWLTGAVSMFGKKLVSINHPCLSDPEEFGKVLCWFYTELHKNSSRTSQSFTHLSHSNMPSMEPACFSLRSRPSQKPAWLYHSTSLVTPAPQIWGSTKKEPVAVSAFTAILKSTSPCKNLWVTLSPSLSPSPCQGPQVTLSPSLRPSLMILNLNWSLSVNLNSGPCQGLRVTLSPSLCPHSSPCQGPGWPSVQVSV